MEEPVGNATVRKGVKVSQQCSNAIFFARGMQTGHFSSLVIDEWPQIAHLSKNPFNAFSILRHSRRKYCLVRWDPTSIWRALENITGGVSSITIEV